MRKTKRKRESSKCQKCKTHVRETVERHQPPEEDEFSLNGESDSDSCQCKEGSNEQGEEGSDEMTLKKILKTTSISRNKQGNP